MRYAPCSNCNGKRDRHKHPKLCRRCRVKKGKYVIPQETKELIIQMKKDNKRFVDIAKLTQVNYNTIMTIHRRSKITSDIPTFYF